jgi:hypothetical protein
MSAPATGCNNAKFYRRCKQRPADYEAADREGVVVAAGPSKIAERVLQALEAADASVAELPGTVAGVCAGGAGIERGGARAGGTADCQAVP